MLLRRQIERNEQKTDTMKSFNISYQVLERNKFSCRDGSNFQSSNTEEHAGWNIHLQIQESLRFFHDLNGHKTWDPNVVNMEISRSVGLPLRETL